MKTSSHTWQSHHFLQDRGHYSGGNFVTGLLAAIRRLIRENPIKFVTLAIWTAFFIGLTVGG